MSQRVQIVFRRNQKHRSFASKFFQKFEDCLDEAYEGYDVTPIAYDVRNLDRLNVLVSFISIGTDDEETITYNNTFKSIARHIKAELKEDFVMCFEDQQNIGHVVAYATSADYLCGIGELPVPN